MEQCARDAHNRGHLLYSQHISQMFRSDQRRPELRESVIDIIFERKYRHPSYTSGDMALKR